MQMASALTGVEKVVQMAAPAAGADGGSGSRCDEQAGLISSMRSSDSRSDE